MGPTVALQYRALVEMVQKGSPSHFKECLPHQTSTASNVIERGGREFPARAKLGEERVTTVYGMGSTSGQERPLGKAHTSSCSQRPCQLPVPLFHEDSNPCTCSPRSLRNRELG